MGNDVWCISERQKKCMRSPLCVNYNRIHTNECTHNSYVWYTRTSRMNEMVWLRWRVYSESRHCIIVDCVCCAFHIYIVITIIILTIQRSYNDNGHRRRCWWWRRASDNKRLQQQRILLYRDGIHRNQHTI